MRKVILFVLIISLFLITLTGCSRGETRSFVYFIDETPKTIDPQLAESPEQITIVTNMFAGLFRKNTEHKIETDMAQSYTVSDDGLEYTFILKDNITYSKGYNAEKDTYVTASEKHPAIKVTAHDFVFAFERVFDKNTNSSYANVFSAIENSKNVLTGTMPDSALGVEAVDDTTLIITLDNPDPEFISKLCLPGAMPCNEEFFLYASGAYGLVGSNKVADNILNNGEFDITVWNDHDGITLRREVDSKTLINRIRLVNERGFYFEPNASKDTIENTVIPTSIERLTNEDSNAEILNSKHLDLFDGSLFSNTIWTLSFNTQDEFFSNYNIRTGISNATRFMPTYTNNLYYPKANGLIPTSVTLFDESFNTFSKGIETPSDNGVEIFKLGLEQLYEQGIVDKYRVLEDVTILVPDVEPFVDIAEQFSQLWQKELSLFFSIKILPIDELIETVESGEYQLAIYPFTASSNDVSSILSEFTTDSPQNVWNYSNETFDRSLNNIHQIVNINQKAEAFADAEQIIINDNICVPLLSETSFFATNNVENIVVSSFGPVMDLKWATDIQ